MYNDTCKVDEYNFEYTRGFDHVYLHMYISTYVSCMTTVEAMSYIVLAAK